MCFLKFPCAVICHSLTPAVKANFLELFALTFAKKDIILNNKQY